MTDFNELERQIDTDVMRVVPETGAMVPQSELVEMLTGKHSRSTVRTAVKRLADMGYIHIKEGRNRSGTKSAHWIGRTADFVVEPEPEATTVVSSEPETRESPLVSLTDELGGLYSVREQAEKALVVLMGKLNETEWAIQEVKKSIDQHNKDIDAVFVKLGR